MEVSIVRRSGSCPLAPGTPGTPGRNPAVGGQNPPGQREGVTAQRTCKLLHRNELAADRPHRREGSPPPALGASFHPSRDRKACPAGSPERASLPCEEGPRPPVGTPQHPPPAKGGDLLREVRQEVFLDVADWKVRASSSRRSRATVSAIWRDPRELVPLPSRPVQIIVGEFPHFLLQLPFIRVPVTFDRVANSSCYSPVSGLLPPTLQDRPISGRGGGMHVPEGGQRGPQGRFGGGQGLDDRHERPGSRPGTTGRGIFLSFLPGAVQGLHNRGWGAVGRRGRSSPGGAARRPSGGSSSGQGGHQGAAVAVSRFVPLSAPLVPIGHVAVAVEPVVRGS